MNFHESLMPSKDSDVREGNIPSHTHRSLSISDPRTNSQLHDELEWICIFFKKKKSLLARKAAQNCFGSPSQHWKKNILPFQADLSAPSCSSTSKTQYTKPSLTLKIRQIYIQRLAIQYL